MTDMTAHGSPRREVPVIAVEVDELEVRHLLADNLGTVGQCLRVPVPGVFRPEGWLPGTAGTVCIGHFAIAMPGVDTVGGKLSQMIILPDWGRRLPQ